MMPKKNTWLVLEIVCVGAYVWYCYSVSQAVSGGDDTGAGFYLGVSKFCFGIARWFGHVGLQSELKYHEILDENRMI